jgi:hypothetical protein
MRLTVTSDETVAFFGFDCYISHSLSEDQKCIPIHNYSPISCCGKRGLFISWRQRRFLASNYSSRLAGLKAQQARLYPNQEEE